MERPPKSMAVFILLIMWRRKTDIVRRCIKNKKRTALYWQSLCGNALIAFLSPDI